MKRKQSTPKNGTPRFSVRPVYRAIVKKNERQAQGLYDVLVCGHAVPAATDNTFRKARPCTECRVRVQEYADHHAAMTRVQPARTAQPGASRAARS